MVHPFEAEFERRGCERMVRLFHTLGDMDGDIAARDDFGEFVRTVYIDLGKQLGFPKENPELPCPDFKPASELPKTGALPVLPKQAVDLMSKEIPKEEPKGKLNSKPASEAFDRNKPGWVYCPNCGSDKIHFGGKDGKKAYCACFDCQIFLNIDDRSQPKITEMKR